MPGEPKHPVKTSQKTIRVLNTIREMGGAGVTELAEELEMNKSTVHSHLSTLEAAEFIVRDGAQYDIGLRLLEFGGYVRNRNKLYNLADPELENLARKSGELAALTVEEYGRSVCLAVERGAQAVDIDLYPGYRRPMHLTAHGKAVLAHLPSDRIDDIVDRHGLPAETSRSITTRSELEAQLATVREQGYAIDEGEYIEGLRCVAAPIESDENTVSGAIGISAPASRNDADRILDELPELVQSSANVVEINLNH